MPPSGQGLGAAAWWTPLLAWASFMMLRGQAQALIPARGVSCRASLPLFVVEYTELNWLNDVRGLFVVDDGVEGPVLGAHPRLGGKLPCHATLIWC